ncbi:related to sterol 14 alpha-demethylase [Serendipita indica DSM 11827]|uniref:Related to sterol 14 alpha-demethylase n=1 Tax=Serendipita indica (strain DSM 11827) TaxID=1109443 RepID=G4TTG3_SERID|nr:related to sterol 14 alpha-demethylase [Serendipita indica DSM 11827]
MTTTTNATKLALPWISSTFKSTTTPAILEKAMENVPMWALLVAGFFGVQIVAVVLNVLRQLVLPKDPNLPPEVFHFYPIIGSAISYGNDPINFFFKCREQYGEVFTFVLLGRKVTVALGPKGNDMILGGKPNVVSAEAAYTHLTTPVFGKHVVYDCPNETLMQQKKFVKFGLNTDNFRAYMGMIEDETSMFMSTDPNFTAIHSKTREWGRFNSFKSMSELTILTASRTLQGAEVRSKLDKTFAQRYNDLDGGFTPLNFLFPSLPLPSYRRRDKAQRAMSEFYQDIIRSRRNGGGDHEHEHDMLAALDQQTYRDGRALTDVEKAHIMIALLMAGQHTSSATSSWTLLHIANNQAVQQALYEEQVKHFGLPGGGFKTMEYEDLKDLPLLDAVIRETLRMHPPLHSLMRKVMQDLPVPQSLAAPSESGSYVIPKGYYVLASPSVAAMDPNVWRNPTEWDPYRWMPGSASAAGNLSGALMARSDEEKGEKVDYGFGMVSKGTESPYQPFGAGRHRCIGENFAYVQLGSIIATMIRALELRLPEGMPEHNYHTMVVVPKSPCDIEYRRRSTA